MFYEAAAFDQVFCWDLKTGSPDSGIHTGPQGSEYTDGMCVCSVGSVLEEDKGNNGTCTTLVVPTAVPTVVPSAVPTVVPTAESGDTAALMALIEALQSNVTSLQSTLSAMRSTDSSQAATIAQQVVKISDQQAFTEDLTATVEDHAVQMAELKAVVDTVKGWKQKVRHGTDQLSTHKVTTGDKQQQRNMHGFDEMIGA